MWSLDRLFTSKSERLLGDFLFILALGLCQFPEAWLDESLGLAVGFRRVGLGVDVADAQGFAQPVDSLGAITRSVVRHRPLDPDAEAFVPGHGCDLEGHAAFLPLALADRTEGQAGVVIDRDMDELLADALALLWPWRSPVM